MPLLSVQQSGLAPPTRSSGRGAGRAARPSDRPGD